MKILSSIKKIERSTVIKNSFLLPIISVVIMSISHVISWYDIGNPFLWAIYLSVAVEIFALASVSAASIKIKKGSIWALFIIVTTIQVLGNVFFTYQDIDVTNLKFLNWMDLIRPWVEDWTVSDHRRFLAYIQGATLPMMSLIALHFYIKFNENLNDQEKSNELVTEPVTIKEELKVEEPATVKEPETVEELKIEEPATVKEPETVEELKVEEPVIAEELDQLKKS